MPVPLVAAPLPLPVPLPLLLLLRRPSPSSYSLFTSTPPPLGGPTATVAPALGFVVTATDGFLSLARAGAAVPREEKGLLEVTDEDGSAGLFLPLLFRLLFKLVTLYFGLTS